MFGTRQQGNGGPPPPPPQEQSNVPPLRKFTVWRIHPLDATVLQEFTIAAHEVEHGASGNIRFLEGVFDPAVNGVRGKVVRCFKDWTDYVEIFEPMLPDSGIIMPSSLLTM